MSDVAFISSDPRGFWHADLYRLEEGETVEDLGYSGRSPDAFFTMRGLPSAVEKKAREVWPEAEIHHVADDYDDYEVKDDG